MDFIGATESRVRTDLDLVYALFLVSLAVALYLLLDPFYTGVGVYRITRDLGLIKYAALILAGGTATLGAAGKGLFDSGLPPEAYSALRRGWPLFVLAAFILGGSAYAKWGLKIQNTLLPSGISFLGFPVAIIIYFTVANSRRLVSTFFWALLIVAPYEIAWIIVKRLEGGQAFHMEIFLIIPLAVYFFYALHSRLFSWAIVACMTLTGLTTNKYTGYGTLAVTLSFLAVPPASRFLRRKDLTLRLAFIYVGFVLGAMIALVSAYLFIHRHQYLPTGDINVRSQTYWAAWQDFLSSPLYGDAFIGSSLQSLVGLTVLGQRRISTHSDLLDILAHGGLLGIGLYLYGLLRVGRLALSAVLSQSFPGEWPQIYGLLSIVACGVFVMAFNPLFMTAQVSSLFWMAVGLLVSTATDALCPSRACRA